MDRLRDYVSSLTPRRRAVAGIVLLALLWLAFSSYSHRRTDSAQVAALSDRVDELAARLQAAEDALAVRPTQDRFDGLHVRLTNVERKLDEERIVLSDALALQREVKALRAHVTTAQRDARAAQSAAHDASKRQPQVVLRPKIETPEIKFEPKIEVRRPPPATPKKSVDVVVKSVRVASRKRGGEQWDGVGDGSPDLKVSISIRGIGGDSGETKTVKNCFEATFNQKIVRVSEGDTIRVTVLDEDALDDDIIGQYDKELTADTFRERTVRWSFDQVESLILEFQP